MSKRNDRLNPATFPWNDFRKWMETQQKEERPDEDLVGSHVHPKISLRKLAERIEVEDGDAEEIANEFKSKGGVISEVDGDQVLIEVSAGSFIIGRHHVRRR